MKKIVLFSSAFLALALILAGCAKKIPVTQQQAEEANGGPGRMRLPDFGQPDRVPDIRGVVKSIVGNEVTILKIDMPAGGMRASTTPEGGDASGSGSKTAVNLIGGSERQGGRMMAGGPGGPGGPGEQSAETRAEMLAKLKEMSAGEEKVIIPVGIQMMKFDTSDGKRTAVEATLADITADKNITIWVSGGEAAIAATSTPATPKTAEFVLIN